MANYGPVIKFLTNELMPMLARDAKSVTRSGRAAMAQSSRRAGQQSFKEMKDLARSQRKAPAKKAPAATGRIPAGSKTEGRLTKAARSPWPSGMGDPGYSRRMSAAYREQRMNKTAAKGSAAAVGGIGAAAAAKSKMGDKPAGTYKRSTSSSKTKRTADIRSSARKPAQRIS